MDLIEKIKDNKRYDGFYKKFATLMYGGVLDNYYRDYKKFCIVAKSSDSGIEMIIKKK